MLSFGSARFGLVGAFFCIFACRLTRSSREWDAEEPANLGSPRQGPGSVAPHRSDSPHAVANHVKPRAATPVQERKPKVLPSADSKAQLLDQCLQEAKIGMELTFTSPAIFLPEAEFESAVEMIADEELRNDAKQLMVLSHMGRMWSEKYDYPYGLWGFAGGLAAVRDMGRKGGERLPEHVQRKLDAINFVDTKVDALQRFKRAVETVCSPGMCTVSTPPKRTLYQNKDDGTFLSTSDVEDAEGNVIHPKAQPVKFLQFKVTYTDGFWWTALIDSWCIEVNSVPVSESGLGMRLEMLQRHIWHTAALAGLYPHPRIGNGHIHFDYISTFGEDEFAAVALRNFIVDYENFPSFPLGVFGDIRDNAPPLAILKRETRQKFQEAIDAWDRGGTQDYKVLVDALNEVYLPDTYMNGDDGRPDWAWRDRPAYGFSKGKSKYHSLNLLPLRGPKVEGKEPADGIGTIEIRGFRPQRSAQDLMDQVLIVHCRAKKMREMALEGHLVQYKSKGYLDRVGRTMPAEDPETLDRPEILHDESRAELEFYVEDAGLRYTTYKRLLQFPD